ncbi:ring finger protein [Sclerotinia borealis F-4128]|uniref:RBR-type E3 ubiquitin transferase n=1 Tax=Sclerotinia borealis (strain F-4128) TaxID=1432307 RepID=W9CKJ4_SCLBF|nr:ring finger protein [Sclerotinia borealis F-4128]
MDQSTSTSSDSIISDQSSATSGDSLLYHSPRKLFDQPIETFTLASTKRILYVFQSQGIIRRTSTLKTLLPKLIDLESKVSLKDHITIAQLLANKMPLTRAELARGYSILDKEGHEVFGGKDQTCGLCYEELPAKLFRRKKLTTECLNNARHTFCTDCVKAYVVSKCETTYWHQITCPGCPEKFEAHDMEIYLCGKLLSNYKEYMRTFAIRDLPGFRWCLSPSCRSGQVHAPGDESPKMICQKCNFATCYTHQLPWHDGKTCEEAGGLKSKEDGESEAWIKSQSKACPGCGVATVKNGGCDAIACSCGEYWIWGAI